MEVYYIKLSYDPKLVEFVKKIFWLIFLLVLAYLYNYYNLKFDTFFSSIYDIILYIILYSHFFHWDEVDFGNIKEKISFALMAESVMISYKKFYYTTTSWFFWTEEVEVTISPNMFTLVISMSYTLSLIIRNNLKVSDRPKHLIMHFANLLFFASLISVFISNNYFYFPLVGKTNITAQTFSGFLIALSWIGVKSLNVIIYPTLAFLSMYRIGEVNKAMGKNGVVYLLCSYFSLILQFFSDSNIEGKCINFLNEFKNDLITENITPTNNVNIANNYFLYANIPPEVEKKIEKKILRKKIAASSICEEKRYQILKLKNGKNINIKLKTLDKTEYDVNINDAEKINKIKLELKVKHDRYRKRDIILLYKGKQLKDDNYICSYGINNGAVIVFLLKPNCK